MGQRPNLSGLEKLFKRGENFKLTDAQYEKETGIAMPKGKSYLKTRSALAKMARDNGYKLEVI